MRINLTIDIKMGRICDLCDADDATVAVFRGVMVEMEEQTDIRICRQCLRDGSDAIDAVVGVNAEACGQRSD